MSKDVSRLLSLVLRHKPETIDIKLDKNGWVSVNELLFKLEEHGKGISVVELANIVETNNKKRFEFSDNGEMIRASQGHSVKVDLELKAKRPPMKLYHGTVQKAIDSIMKNGMTKMRRHAIHLSHDIPTAMNVGSRRGDAILLTINSGAMYAEKYKFYESKNGVWLTDVIPPKYIEINK